MTTKENNNVENTSIFSPQVLRAINSYLKSGDLICISLSANMSYAHVRRIMTGNRGNCLCGNINSQRIVKEALEVLKLRRTEHIANKEKAVTDMNAARKIADTSRIAIAHIDKLLAMEIPTQNENTENLPQANN